ncbi:MAG: hypothetical protein IT395_05060 [Candidatus Omnitrophica bacterium]|nr:hypothetical protein [Candidatus Omnitrophota bacterium]
MLAILLLFFGVLSRLWFHVPNFTPVLALALFGGVYLSPRRALLMPLVLMIASDLLIGLHDTILFTWGSVVLISALGLYLRGRKSSKNIVLASLASAVIFFVISNFGAWIMMYPKTWAGVAECFWAAVPFFRWTLLSTLIYSVALFYGYEVLAERIAKTRFAKALLS